MAREFKTGITAAGDISTSGVLKSTQSAANEGGQVELSVPSSGSTIAGTNVTIDIYQNRLRFFESGGSNRGFYLDVTAAATSVGTNLAGGASYTAPTLAGTTLSSGGTINTLSGELTADKFLSSNNGSGTNFKVGDDAWIGDVNLANTIRIKGQQDSTQGYISFGDSDAKLLGRSGTGALTFDANTIWHAGNDGSGSGLDADTLDGSHASAFAASSHTHAASDVTSGTLSISRIPTGTTSSTVALGDHTHSTYAPIASPTFTGTVTAPTIVPTSTTVGTTVSSLTPGSPSAGIVTYNTAAAHGLVAGQVVTITGLSTSSYNVTNARIYTVPSTTSFTINNTTTGGTTVGQSGTITTALLTVGSSSSTIALTTSPIMTLPLFIVRKTANTTLTPTTNTIINFSTSGSTPVNRGGFTMSSGVVTVPTAGWYRIRGTAYWDSAVTTGNNRVTYIYINGTAATRMNSYGGLTYDFIVETAVEHVYLLANDTVDLRVYGTAPSNQTILAGGSDTNFQYGTSLYIEYKGA